MTAADAVDQEAYPISPASEVSPARLAIVAGYPPPFGGVTTHVRRLSHHLGRAGVEHIIYNTASDTEIDGRVVSVAKHRNWWVLRYVIAPDSCVYLMSPRIAMWFAGALIAQRRGRFVAVRLQNSKVIDEVGRRSLRGRICGMALRRFDRVVCVNAEQIETLAQIGVDRERIRHFPGFLPPSDEEFAPSTVSQGVWDFIGSGCRPLIAATGRVAWHDGVDLYGFDMLIELVARLTPDYPDLSLVVCLWDYRPETDGERIRELLSRAEEFGVGARVYFNLERGGFLPVLRVADVMVRPTATDGDANTVREALTLGIPAVASDVVERPAGTLVAANRDLADLERLVRQALSKREAHVAGSVVLQHLDAYVDELSQWTRTAR